MSPWLGLALVLVFSGMVAYIGDLLGRRVGRKRLSVFGLRPRNTAILFTIVTGMLIAGCAMAVLLLTSRDLRDRILHYRDIVAGLQQQEETQRALANRRKQELEETERQLEQAKAERAKAAADLERASNAVADALAARQAAERQVAVAGRQAAAKTRELSTAQRRLGDARHDLSQARRRYDDAVRRVSQAQARVAQVQAALVAGQQDLERLNAATAEMATELENAKRILLNMRDAAQTQVHDADAQVEAAKAELRQIEGELEQARRERDLLWDRLNQAEKALWAEVIFPTLSELGRYLMPGDLPRAEVRDRLDGFVRELDRKARDAGAGIDADTGYYAVPIGLIEGHRIVPPDDFLPALAVYLAGDGRARWLRAIVLVNGVEGQPVYYTFDQQLDQVAFAAGEVIAADTIDGAADEAAIARGIERLVRERVNAAAESRHMLPNATGRRVEVSPEQWLPVLRRLKQLGGPSRVEVVAAQELRVGDPPAIAFRVEAQ